MKSPTTKTLIAKQGPAGQLVLTLRRYALLGWVLFFCTALYLGLYILVKTAQPIPVLTLDEQGRITGRVDYANPLQRTDGELIADSKYFLLHHLSANSATIYEDAAIALSMMDQSLREKTLAQYKQTNQLRQIEQADVTSRITFARDDDKAPQIAWRREDTAGVRLQGEVRIGDDTSNAYAVELTVRIVPRTLDDPHGLEILAIRDI